MKEQFVTYEIALELKELGFNEECLAKYNGGMELVTTGCYTDSPPISLAITQNDICEAHVLAPLWQQVIDWLREEHDLHINVITRYHELHNKRYWQFTIFRISQPNNNRVEESDFMYDTFDKNIKQAILTAIELIKNNNLK